jgi:hypothetical protein
MIDNDAINQALKKKDKEIEKANQKLEEMKKSYETKIKNLMSSINQLKAEKTEVESFSKDNVRVNIINNLKKDLKDKENVITLLRKLIGDEEKVDKFLLKEFGKQGESRIMTYEEMKIKQKQLEGEIVTLKHKLSEKHNKTSKAEEVDNSAVFIRQIELQKDEIEKINSELTIQINENIILKVNLNDNL